jgi:ferredoxin-NADP reductase
VEGTAVLGGLVARTPLPWRETTVRAIRPETPRVKTLVLDVPGWPGHAAGQHVDIRLTAEDGYQAQRSYSIASGPGSPELEYVCGPTPFVEEAARLLVQLGHEPARVHTERFGPTGG